MSWAEAHTPELAGVCRKCTGVGFAHYLTCPTLNCPAPVRGWADERPAETGGA